MVFALPVTVIAKPVFYDARNSNPNVLTFKGSELWRLNLSVIITMGGEERYVYETSGGGMADLEYLGDAGYFTGIEAYLTSNPNGGQSQREDYFDGTNLEQIFEGRNFRETIDHLLYLYDSNGLIGLIEFLLAKPGAEKKEAEFEEFTSQEIFSKLRVRSGVFELKDTVKINGEKVSFKGRVKIEKISVQGEDAFVVTLLSVRQVP